MMRPPYIVGVLGLTLAVAAMMATPACSTATSRSAVRSSAAEREWARHEQLVDNEAEEGARRQLRARVLLSAAEEVALEHAARDFGCLPDELLSEDRGSHRFDIYGCQHRATYLCGVSDAEVVVCRADGWRAAMFAAARQYARDQGCEMSDVGIFELRRGRYRVRGCTSERQVYECAQDGDVLRCARGNP